MRHLMSAATAVASMVALSAGVAGASAVIPPRDPARNLVAVPAFSITSGKSYEVGSALPPCWRWSGGQLALNPTSTTCVAAEVAATNHAHALEHISAITLPKNYARLSSAEQMFVLANLERVSRGETPVVGLSRAVDAMALVGARANADPSFTRSASVPGATGGWTANWAAAANSLDANYSWMYLDGWGGQGHTFNYDCTSPTAAGCWGHRNDILVDNSNLRCYASTCELVMGAAAVAKNWDKTYNSYTELFVQVTGASPALYYTWRQAVAAGARG